jgi:hypothetical protein
VSEWETVTDDEWETVEEPKVSGATTYDRAGAVGAGFNSGVAGLLGLPVDTTLNVVELINAGLGYGASKFNKGKVPEAFDKPIDRSQVAGSSEWLRNLANKSPVTTTQMSRPDDVASQYLHAGGSALPGVAMMRPTTIGQAASATTANVVPTIASKATADATQGTPYETTAPILASLLGQAAASPLLSQRTPKPVDLERRNTLIESQKAGYAVPPATTNPTVLNKLLESYGGKVGTQQDAAAKAANVTTELTRKALGLSPDTPVTNAETTKIRTAAGRAYQAVRKAGTIQADAKYRQGLQDIAAKNSSASQSFPGLGNDEVAGLIKKMDVVQFDADNAVDAIQLLRERSSELYAKGDKSVGKAYKQVAAELEGAIERSLPPKSKALDDFRAARKEIAKTYSVDKALEGGSTVSAYKLGKQLEKGTPLEGDLKTAAKFGQAFPKIGKPVLDSGSTRNTDVIVGGATAAMSKEPSLLMYPFSRMAMRDFLLSPVGQKLAVPSLPKNYVQLQTPEQQRALLMLNQSLLSQ